MREFRDDQGRPWQLALTTAAAMRVRDNVKMMKDGEEKPFDIVDFSAIGDTMDVLRGQYITIAETLYFILLQQIEKKGITKDEFFDGLRGDAIDAATKVLEEELVDFFPERLRKVVRLLAAKAQEATEAGTAKMEQQLEKMSVTDLLAQSGTPSGSVPEYWESTPANGHSENSLKHAMHASRRTGGTRRTSSAKSTT